MTGTNSKGKIQDGILYRLLDVERLWGVPNFQIIQRATQVESRVRLCMELEPWHEVHLLEADKVAQQSAQGLMNAGIGASDLNYNMQRINTYKILRVAGLIIRQNICKDFLINTNAPNSLMDEIYVHSDSGVGISLLCPDEYLRLHPEIRGTPKSLWRFAVFPSGIRSKNFEMPKEITVSRDKLCIYGMELRRYFDEIDFMSNGQGVGSEEKPKAEKAIRDTCVRRLIKDAIEHYVMLDQYPSEMNVMAYLKSMVGRDHCLTRYDGEKVWWRKTDGKEDFVTLATLKDRLDRLEKTEATLFCKDHYLSGRD